MSKKKKRKDDEKKRKKKKPASETEESSDSSSRKSKSRQNSSQSSKRQKQEAKPVSKNTKSGFYLYGANKDRTEIPTPQNVLDVIREEFGKDVFDPCPYERPEWDGLEVPWGKVNYVNPPFKGAKKWMFKAVKETRERGSTTAFFFPNRTNARFWQQTVWPYANEHRSITGPIRFVGYNKNIPAPMTLIVYTGDGRRIHGRREPKLEIPKDYLTKKKIIKSEYLRVNCPLLWFCAKHSADIERPKDARFLEWRSEWAQKFLSAETLFEKWLNPKEADQTWLSLIGVYAQFCFAERTLLGDVYASTREGVPPPTAHKELSFFRLLSALRPNLDKYSERIANLAPVPDCDVKGKANVIRMLDQDPVLLAACNFFIVYREYRKNEWCRRNRFNYEQTSFDGKFTQQINFLN